MSVAQVFLYVALLDVLAYRQRLELDRNSGRLDFHDDLAAALQVFDPVNDAIFHVRAISDTIIITCPTHAQFPELLDLLRKAFVSFTDHGLYVRGGIAFSRHFESSRLTYSHALARAYELESTLASYPRIVIDENIIGMYESGTDMPDIKDKEYVCVENGVYFLNILTSDNWQQVYDNAVTIFKKTIETMPIQEDVLNKHIRMQKYLLESPHAPNYLPYVTKIETLTPRSSRSGN
jgi:hypothetical protein